nr:hypothetical protein [Salmonid herpesvirus 1]
MAKLGSQLGGDIVGAFHDLESVLGSTVTVEPLVPIVQGPVGKYFTSVHNAQRGQIVTIYHEHLAYVSAAVKSTLSVDQRWESLQRALSVWRLSAVDAQADIDAGDAALHVAVKVPLELPEVKPMPEERGDLLGSIHDEMMDGLAFLDTKMVALGDEGDMLALCAQIDMGGPGMPIMPHVAFTKLCYAYVALYQGLYPILDTVGALANALHMENVVPEETTVAYLSPLFVYKKLKKETREVINGRTVNVATTFIAVDVFRGFLMEFDSSYNAMYWDGLGGSREYPEIIDPKRSCALGGLQRMATMRDYVIENAPHHKENEVWQEAAAAARRGNNFFNTAGRMGQSSFSKSIKLWLQSPMAIAIMQSQLRMSTSMWSVSDAPASPEGVVPTERMLEHIKSFAKSRFVDDIKMIMASSLGSFTPLGIFSVDDVDLHFDEKYGSVKKASAVPGADGKGGFPVTKVWFQTGNTSIRSLLENVVKKSMGCQEGRSEEGVAVMGLWSVYNFNEFTEFASLSIPTKELDGGAARAPPVVDLSDLKKFVYKLKWGHGAPPCAVLQQTYVTRTALFTTVGAMLAIGSENYDPSHNSPVLSSSNLQIQASVGPILQNVLSGFFIRTRGAPGTKTTSFDVEVEIAKSKASALMHKQMGPRGRENLGGFFHKLEWVGALHNKGDARVVKFPKKLKQLAETFNVKQMILDAETAAQNNSYAGIFYLRPVFISMSNVEKPISAIVNNKKAYNNTPVAMTINFQVAKVGTSWCTTHMKASKGWDTHKVYRVIIGTNAVSYSKDTIDSWCLNNTGFGDMQLDTTVEGFYSALLGDTAPGDKVTTSLINTYGLNKAIYDNIATRLKLADLYCEDEAPFYNDDEEYVAAPKVTTTEEWASVGAASRVIPEDSFWDAPVLKKSRFA